MGKPTAQQTQATQIQVTVSLNPAALEYAKKNSKENDLSATLGSWMTFWIDQQSRGGIMVSPEDHDYLAELANGKRFTSSRQLASAVAKGLKRDDGQFASVAKVDPALIVPLQDQAAQMGWTVEELITDALNQVLTNSWVASLEPDFTLRFTAAAMARLKAIVGKEFFFGEELVAALENPAGEKEPVAA